MNHHFSRYQRIVKTDDFSSVFRLRHARRSYRTPHFVLHTKAAGQANARLGLVVGKRFAPRAVTRNTIKRVAREYFRQSSLPLLDYIVQLNKPLILRADKATSTVLKHDLNKELAKLFGLVKEVA